MPFADAAAYFEQQWGNCKATVSEISKNDKGVSLVKSDTVLFNFDKICNNIFPKGKERKSADALRVSGNCIELIEFKGGFKRNITKHNFDPNIARCELPGNQNGEICPLFYIWYDQRRKKEEKELITKIRDKAIECYVALYKNLLPNVSSPVQLKLTVVVDGNGDDKSVGILTELAKKVDESNSPCRRVRESLKGITDIVDFNRNIYYYKSEDVEVFFADKFESMLEKETIE